MNRFIVALANYVPRARWGKVWSEPHVPEVQLRFRESGDPTGAPTSDYLPSRL